MLIPKRIRNGFLLLILAVFSLPAFSQITCSPGNLFVYANYDGGVLNIHVDVNIPNIKIGICTYEPVTINLTGTYLNNVTEVRYAGYVSTNNNHCSNSPTTTTIVGAPAGATTSVLFLPSATLSNSNGNNSIVCAYSCVTTSSQGGCNTADQIKHYFETTTGGTLAAYYTQYGCWSSGSYSLSGGGNCCTATPCTITADAGADTSVCNGNVIMLMGSGTGGVSTYIWSPATGLNNPNIANPLASPSVTTTYVLTTSDGANCTAMDTVVVSVNTAQVNFVSPGFACLGQPPIGMAGGSPAGGTYSGPGITANTFDPQAAGLGAHVVTYTATDSNGCVGSDTALVTVLDTPSVTIDPQPSFCEFSPPYVLTGANPSGGDFFGPGVTNGIFDPAQAGQGTHILGYSVMDSNGCTGSNTFSLTVGASPVSPTISWPFPLDSLYASTVADSFHWFRDNLMLPYTTQAIPAMPTAIYEVVAYVGGCPSDTSVELFIEVIGIEDDLAGSFRVYPNPVKDQLQIETAANSYSAWIMDLQGRILWREQEISGDMEIDLRTVSSGLYFVNIRMKDALLLKKIVKQE